MSRQDSGAALLNIGFEAMADQTSSPVNLTLMRLAASYQMGTMRGPIQTALEASVWDSGLS